ncbi:pancreatic lipase-related protein 3 [Bubalus kerabau]|uniref:pancreatic lipase-related protein 3 n=1 Tax=Bubalus bubalis TaxID=89462 RepID=UPI001E1B7BA0|nr:pancreatic lipase-related protein 3 [Bubalus bubalis]XP_055416299.1 pancreatic lipase-related protein 3 [Bubalus carabanensis]
MVLGSGDTKIPFIKSYKSYKKKKTFREDTVSNLMSLAHFKEDYPVVKHSRSLGLVPIILTLYLLAAGEEVCYERVGCFKDGLPWTGTFSRQFAGLPWSPEKINTRFLLYTRQNPKVHQEVSAVNYLTIRASHFATHKITRINIPGWKSDGKWQQDMCNVLLKVEDVNCINLDWINGSLQYIHAVNNLRVVGAEVAYFIDVLVKKFGYSASKVHLIGHSLGAHLAGEAGSRTPGLGRITGLDPAGPCFHDTPNEVRLDPSDANFVDVIHTNAVRLFFELGVGTINACGHLDFYPNGGKHMPGCEDLITPLFKFDLNIYKEEVFSFFDCNHARSHRFYAESILNPDAFIAYPCRSYKSFKAGNCFHCPKEGCPTMGHFADRFHLKKMKPNRLYYFLNTGTISPFARWRHKLSVKLDGNNVTQGSIFLRVGGTIGKTGEFEFVSGTLKPGMTYTDLIDADINVGNITSIEFIWKEYSFERSQSKLGAEMVIDISGKYGYKSAFCSQNIVGPNIAQILKPC